RPVAGLDCRPTPHAHGRAHPRLSPRATGSATNERSGARQRRSRCQGASVICSPSANSSSTRRMPFRPSPPSRGANQSRSRTARSRAWRRSTSAGPPPGQLAGSGSSVEPASAAIARSPESSLSTRACRHPARSGSVPPPQNHTELIVASPAAARSALRGWLCRMTCASLSKARQRRPSGPAGRCSNRSSPSASSIGVIGGRPLPFASLRYQRVGTGASSDSPASSNTGRKASANSAASLASSSKASPWDKSLTPFMSGRTWTGSARSHRPSPASPASCCRVAAATGQVASGMLKCRAGPGASSCDRSPRPSQAADTGPSRWPPKRARPGSSSVVVPSAMSGDVAYGGDLVLAGAPRRVDADLVAGVLSDQGPGDRRGNRDQPLLDVGLEVANDLPGLLLVGIQVDQFDRGAKHHLVADIELGHVDDLGVGQLGLELLDPALDETLLFAGGVVFGVFLQVTVGARFRDRGDDFRTLDRLEFFKLGAQALGALVGDR